jgi:hypothetical protein
MAQGFGVNGMGGSSATNNVAMPQTAAPAIDTQVEAQSLVSPSKVVERLIQQDATPYVQGLARIPLPERPAGVPRTQPKKSAGPMVAPRSLDGGQSPLAPMYLQDARTSTDLLGATPGERGEMTSLYNADAGAEKLPSRHGLVAYTTNARGDSVYLTQDRWMHIRENHMDVAPQPRGKRTTTYWPTQHAVNAPSMNDDQVLQVIVDAARKGTLRSEVRDTRMAEYDLPRDDAQRYGVSEAKVSMAPDGLVLSAYPAAGRNVLAVYETTPEDHAALVRWRQSQQQNEQQIGAAPITAGTTPTTFG